MKLAGPKQNDTLSTKLKLPAHAIYTRWVWEKRLSSVEFDITMHNDPGTETGEYLSPFNGEIDGAQIYFGIQTNVFKPKDSSPGCATGTHDGKGIIFSSWASFDSADTRVAPDGFIQLGTHEGRFVGVRRPYEWGVASYRLRLARAESDTNSQGITCDWFTVTVQQIVARTATQTMRPSAFGEQHWIGSLRFTRADPDVPATLSATGTTFLEVYDNASTFRRIAPWWCDLQGYGDGDRALRASSEYPEFPHKQAIVNADTWFDHDRDRVHLRFGGDISRTTPAGPLFDTTA
jgi:hypothetical protein